MQRTVAVVDDDPAQRYLLANAVERAGFKSVPCRNGREALENAGRCQLMLLDVRLPDMGGLEVLGALRNEHPSLPVILITAFIDLRDAIGAVKSGAFDYLEKPVDLDELITTMEAALGPLNQTGNGSAAMDVPDGVIIRSDVMRQVYAEACRVANSTATVLILGESGTGKEILARFVHTRSLRTSSPFVRVDCGAMPDHLIASELFGHERGAFTGADNAHVGLFEEADGGTVFLDEVGELPLELQPRLLYVIETGRFRRVGGSRELSTNVRIIAATNVDLTAAIDRGSFRKDLYYRLNVISTTIPPLRQHLEDVLPYAEHYLRSARKHLTPSAQRVLMNHAWPGNFRELRNVLEHASIMSHGSGVLPADFPDYLLHEKSPSFQDSILVGNMRDIEKRAILEALRKTGGNKTHAADLLGISRSNLSYKLRDYQV
jgi:DNA-binding NtrC family response regulator